MKSEFNIGRRTVGPDHPVYFIADIAANHDGDIERAKDLIYACSEAGADAAKFQNFKAETIVSDYGFKHLGLQASHQSSWKKSVSEVYKDASIPTNWSLELKETCDDAGVDYMTTPYDISMIDRLSEYVCAWKLGSGDITWHENIERLSKDDKPLLIATGASNLKEVQMALNVANTHTDELVIMQCNTNYTGSIENFKYISLNVLKTYKKMYPDIVLGLSDHTPGHTTVLGAVTLGAKVIEKHFTDNIYREGPDHKFSMDPKSWKNMVCATRELELALGSEEKKVMGNEKDTVIIQRRSIRAKSDLCIGTTVNHQDFEFLRPCTENCLPPYYIGDIVGRKLIHNVKKGDCISFSDFL